MLNLQANPATALAVAHGDHPVKRLPWIALAATAFLLAACHRPAIKDQSVAAGPERAGPVSWNAANGGFELGGKPLKTVKLWTFDGSTEGFTTVTSHIEPAAGQGVSVAIVDPTIRSPKGLNVPGGQYSLVLVRLTRTAPASDWDGALYYTTPVHGEAIGFLGKPLSGANPKVGETTTLVYDMSHQTLGGHDWMQSTIDRIRFDIEDKPGGAFVIRQIAIAANPDPAALAAAAATGPPPSASAPAPKS
jgi:hypothetical protein